MSGWVILFAVLPATLGLVPAVQLVRNFVTKPSHLLERQLRNSGLLLLCLWLGFSLALLGWINENTIIGSDGSAELEVSKTTRNVLDGIWWLVLLVWAGLFAAAWILKKRRIKAINRETSETFHAIYSEYGPEEALKIAARTGLFGRLSRAYRDEW